METDIGVGFDGVREVFRTPQGAPDTVASTLLLAVAYAAGQHDELLSSDPESFLQSWEAKIDDRSQLPAETGAAATQAYNTAFTAAATEAARLAVKMVKATKGTFSLMGTVRNLPAVFAGNIELSGFPRLRKITPGGAITTARLRALASRVGVTFPDDADVSEEASVAWVWGLATLSRGITLKAAGWLQKAYASDQAAWDTAVQALGADGRFPVDYMTGQRVRMREAREERERLARNGGGFDATLTPVQAWDHVATSIVDDDMAREVAKAVSNATAAIHGISLDHATFDLRKVACGTALVAVLRHRNQAIACAPVMPATSSAEALQSIVAFFFKPRPEAALDAPLGTAPAGSTAPAGQQVLTLSPETLAALGAPRAPATTEAVDTGSNSIVLRSVATEKVVGSLKRPEFFAPCDITAFRTFEDELLSMQKLEDDEAGNGLLLERYRALPERARALVSVPVNPTDLGKNHCLNVLSVLADRITAIGDDLIIKGTVLGSERDHDTQREDDRERAKLVAKLRQGDVITAGPQICLADYKLASAYDFVQIPYLHGEVASDINGDWDATWFLWASVAETQIGQDCEVEAGVAAIVKMVRQTARSGRVPWTHQERTDYAAYALYLFRRDYRDWREHKANSEKPSLLRILESHDFKEHLRHAFDYANKPETRPNIEPYNRVIIGKVAPKKKRKMLTADEIVSTAQQAAADSAEKRGADSTPTPPPPKKPKPKTPPTKDKVRDAGGKEGSGKGRGGDRDGSGGGRGRGGGKGKSDKTQDEKPQWQRIEGGGSAWPDMEHRLSDEQCAIAQSKIDVSNDVDKGSCAYCFLGSNGCKHDKRVGVVGKGCHRSHSAPKGQEGSFCRALCKTVGLQGTLYLKNKLVWTKAPSSCPPATPTREPSPVRPEPDDDGSSDGDGNEN